MQVADINASKEYSKVISSIDANITVYLRHNNMRQNELAKLVGLSEVQFSRKRRGIFSWKLSEIMSLGTVLGKSLKELTSL